MRRTPTLTAECRRLFEEMFVNNSIPVWSRTRAVAQATGLDPAQVRDAIWGVGADRWRQAMYGRMMRQGLTW